MSRTRIAAAELFCARCGRGVRRGAAHWPEGYLCATCHTHALETYGRCAGCGVDRLTPGIASDGGRLCTDCAGGLGEFFCELCGREARRHRRGVCGNCVLAERLSILLDDGSGSIRPELIPFAEGLCRMSRPRSGLTWIANPHVQQMLRTLADPSTPITHETLNSLSPWRSVTYLRDLLMHHGVLPPPTGSWCCSSDGSARSWPESSGASTARSSSASPPGTFSGGCAASPSEGHLPPNRASKPEPRSDCPSRSWPG